MRNKYLYIILLSFIYSSAGASYEYGHSARSVSLSSSLVAANYNNFNSDEFNLYKDVLDRRMHSLELSNWLSFQN